MRSNSLETVGDIMAVAYQVQKHGQKPAGFELFDISIPEKPEVDRLRRRLRARLARRAPAVVLRRRDRAHGRRRARLRSRPTRSTTSSTAPSTCAIRRSPWRSAAGGCRARARATARRRPRATSRRATTWASAPTTPTSIRSAPTAATSATSTAACSSSTSPTRRNPKPLCRWDNSPPFCGFTHTVLPLFERELLIVTDESVVDDAKDWPKLIWILDGREETNPVPIATCPVDDVEDYAKRGGRFGAHNIHENVPLPTSWHSDRIILGTFFNGGLRAYDIANPYQPEEVGIFVPPAPKRCADRRHPAQRRVRRRAPGRLRRRPPHRRALHPGDEFLTSDLRHLWHTRRHAPAPLLHEARNGPGGDEQVASAIKDERCKRCNR